MIEVGQTHFKETDMGSLADKKYKYTYPKGMDLSPNSELSKKVLKIVNDSARESWDYMNKRHDRWGKVEDTLQAYISMDEHEAAVKAKDVRKPVAVVIPTSFAILDILMTYQIQAFLSDSPVFQFNGRGPEDIRGAALLEMLVDWQLQQSSGEQALITQWRDGWVFGFGVATPVWKVRKAYKTIAQPLFDPITREAAGVEKARKEYNSFEGNVIKNISPYMYLPDVNVPIHQPQDGESVGFVIRDNYHNLLQQEQEDSQAFFNIKYLKHIDGRCQMMVDPNTTQGTRPDAQAKRQESKPIDVIWSYRKIVPKDLGIGTSDKVEMWTFAIAGGEVVIGMAPTGLDHNQFPVSVFAPDTDGRSVTPVSRLEVIQPLAEATDWLLKSRFANVRKMTNGITIVDPYMVNMRDMAADKPAKIVRTRKAAWGKGVDGAVKQLNVQDTTQNHTQDIGMLLDIAKNVTGAVDVAAGQISGGDRTSALEAGNAHTSAVSRLARAAKMASIQSMRELGKMMASQTQQLMTEDTHLAITGDWTKIATEATQSVNINPFDILVNFDTIVSDNSQGTGDNLQALVNMFQQVTQNEMLTGRFDIDKLFTDILLMSGVKNAQEYKMAAQPQGMPQVDPQLMGQEQLQAGLQSGNIAPVSEVI